MLEIFVANRTFLLFMQSAPFENPHFAESHPMAFLALLFTAWD
jgi:hypothetical protein